MSENQKKVLQMVAEGKVSVDEAMRLLSLVDARQPTASDTREFDLHGFTRIEAGRAVDIEVVRAESFGVKVTADDFNNIVVEQENDILKIRRQGITLPGRFVTPKVRVTMPELYEITLSGSSRGAVRDFQSSHELVVRISGASRLKMQNMSAGDVSAELSGAVSLSGDIKTSGKTHIDVNGASKFELSGSGQDVVLKVSGASHIKLNEFLAQNMEIKLSGASSGAINLKGRLDAKLNGASNLTWVGNPTMGNIVTSGASHMRPG